MRMISLIHHLSPICSFTGSVHNLCYCFNQHPFYIWSLLYVRYCHFRCNAVKGTLPAWPTPLLWNNKAVDNILSAILSQLWFNCGHWWGHMDIVCLLSGRSSPNPWPLELWLPCNFSNGGTKECCRVPAGNRPRGTLWNITGDGKVY